MYQDHSGIITETRRRLIPNEIRRGKPFALSAAREGDTDMKSKLLVLALFAGVGSLFAQSRFSISVGGYAPGYYDGPGYYAPLPQRGYDHPYDSRYRYARPGAGYWGSYDPQREHERAEWYGLHNHQGEEQFRYGDSEALREHQSQERWELKHEQWHERHGDFDAADGPAHGSASDGYRFGY